MKNLVYALVGAGFMIACQPSDQPEISGMLTGIERDTLLVQSFPVNDRDSRRTCLLYTSKFRRLFLYTHV